MRSISLAIALIAFGPAGVAPAATSSLPTATSPPATSGPASPAPSPPKRTTKTRVTGLPGVVTNGTAPLVVRLSGAPAPGSPAPTIYPHVAGSWTVAGNDERFKPASTLEPCSTYTLTIWAQTTAMGRAPLGTRRTIALTVACPSVKGLQQALARLRYLPYAVKASRGRNSGGRPEARARAARYAFDPPSATLVADERDAPGLSYGTLDPTTRGALMVFQAAHGHTPTGAPDRSTWVSLLAAETLGHGQATPYTFLTVSESIPETLEVHRGGRVVLTSPANTGVPGAATQQGTFPIYARYVSTTMTGTNPDGTHYSDPGVPWVNYFNGGDAVHGFPRASYGSPQSNGCVELPIETAARVYPLLAIGDLVIVT